nr:hypothetical protein [uncultured Sphingomonas sp.]
MTIRMWLAAASVSVVPAEAMAGQEPMLHPVAIGAETARFDHGQVSVQLRTPHGVVEVRPMPVEKDRIVFSIAVLNSGKRPANLGTEYLTAQIGGVPAPIPSYAELVEAAERKARNTRIGTALVTGVIAGVASTASNQGTVYRHIRGPHGGFAQAIHWEDNTPGMVGAVASVTGGAMVIGGINNKLDYTIAQLGRNILQTTTIDPGGSFGGLFVVARPRHNTYPTEIRLQVRFGGIDYPFAFLLAPAGMMTPPPPRPTALDQEISWRSAERAPVLEPQLDSRPADPNDWHSNHQVLSELTETRYRSP